METGHKTFDKQTDYVGYGNVHANTMYGWYVRAWNDLTPDGTGRVPAPGEYTLFDLKCSKVEQIIKDNALSFAKQPNSTGVIVYQFHHWHKRNKIVHGGLITTWDGRERLRMFINGGVRSGRIVNLMAESILAQHADFNARMEAIREERESQS